MKKFIIPMLLVLLFVSCTNNEKEISESNNTISQNLHRIEDKRDIKTDIVGKYVSIYNSSLFFEIYDNYAILSESLEDLASGSTLINDKEGMVSKNLEIEQYGNLTILHFTFQKKNDFWSFTIDFYSEGIDSFIWERYEYIEGEPAEHIFKKQ